MKDCHVHVCVILAVYTLGVSRMPVVYLEHTAWRLSTADINKALPQHVIVCGAGALYSCMRAWRHERSITEAQHKASCGTNTA